MVRNLLIAILNIFMAGWYQFRFVPTGFCSLNYASPTNIQPHQCSQISQALLVFSYKIGCPFPRSPQNLNQTCPCLNSSFFFMGNQNCISYSRHSHTSSLYNGINTYLTLLALPKLGAQGHLGQSHNSLTLLDANNTASSQYIQNFPLLSCLELMKQKFLLVVCKCMTAHFVLFNFIPPLLLQSSRLSGSICIIAWSSSVLTVSHNGV